MITLQEVKFTNRNDKAPVYESPEIKHSAYFEAYWQTPGSYIANRIINNQLVRFVGEKVQTDYLQTIIVVDNDTEELLDKIFSVEQELYTKFQGLRFDVRIRTIPPEEDIGTIKRSTIGYYDRDQYNR